MFQFVGYNLFSDEDALAPSPGYVGTINSVTLSNAIFEHFNATRNTNTEVSTQIPTAWDYDTIMDADFANNIDAGNVDLILEQISSIRIKRRERNSFDWITLANIPVNTIDDLTFAFNDTLNKYGVEYEYAFVPVINDVEGEYYINSIMSVFNGVFIGDLDNIYKLFYEVGYSSNARNQQVGVFEVLGKQYPVIVANGSLSYESGTVTATIMNDDFEENGLVDRTAIVQRKDELKNFLTNKRAKILKDWNGNMWLCVVNGNIDVSYKSNYGMGIPSISFRWTEIGDAESQTDLYNNGILTEVS